MTIANTLRLGLLSLGIAGPAWAQDPLHAWAQAQSALCDAAIGVAETQSGVPSGLLSAVAKSESGRPLPPSGKLGPWPWTINLEGQGYFFDTKAAAVAFARNATAQGPRSMDVGCNQVNLLHHPAAFTGLDAAFDPGTNAAYAARFLRSLKEGPGGGNWYEAVGFYHSQTPGRAAWYRERVAAIAEGRAPPRGGPAPLYARAIQRGAVRLQLAGGGVMVIMNRQPRGMRPIARDHCTIVRTLGDYLPTQARRCSPAPRAATNVPATAVRGPG